MAKPIGTPVCFSENTIPNHSRGTRWESTWADAGLIGPCAAPMKTTASTVAGIVATALTASPMAPISRAIWLTRTAPSRTIGPAAARAVTAAMP